MKTILVHTLSAMRSHNRHKGGPGRLYFLCIHSTEQRGERKGAFISKLRIRIYGLWHVNPKEWRAAGCRPGFLGQVRGRGLCLFIVQHRTEERWKINKHAPLPLTVDREPPPSGTQIFIQIHAWLPLTRCTPSPGWLGMQLCNYFKPGPGIMNSLACSASWNSFSLATTQRSLGDTWLAARALGIHSPSPPSTPLIPSAWAAVSVMRPPGPRNTERASRARIRDTCTSVTNANTHTRARTHARTCAHAQTCYKLV